MSSKGIQIPLVVDTAKALKPVDDVADAFADVSDALDDVARTSQQTETTMSRELDQAADSAGDAAKTTQRTFSDAFDSLKRDAKTAGDKVGTDVKKGADDAGEGISALKDNAAANAKEMAGSFTDVESVIGGLQGYAAEALEGFGPMGVGAGVAMGAGIGIAQQALQKVADKVNELKEKAGELARAWRDATDADQVQALADQWDELTAQIVDNRSWFEPWQKEAVTAIDKIAAAAKIDRPVVEAFMAAFNETDPIDRQQDLAKVLDDTRAAAAELGTKIDDLKMKQNAAGRSASAEFTPAEQAALKAAEEHKAALDGLIPTMQTEADQARTTATEIQAMADAAGLSVDAYKAQQQALSDAQDAAASYADQMASQADVPSLMDDAFENSASKVHQWAQAQADATADADDTWEDYAADAAPAKALDDVIGQMESKIAANVTFEHNLKTLADRGFGALAVELQSAGPEANGKIVQALSEATDETVQRFATDRGTLTGKTLAQGTATGVANNSDFLKTSIEQTLNKALSDVTSPVITFRTQLDTGQLDTDLAKLAKTPHTVEFMARLGKQVM